MDTNKIRQQLHELVDKIDNEDQLNLLHEAAEMYAAVELDDKDPELTEEQYKKLEASIQQANEGKLIPHDEVMQMAKQWRTK